MDVYKRLVRLLGTSEAVEITNDYLHVGFAVILSRSGHVEKTHQVLQDFLDKSKQVLKIIREVFPGREITFETETIELSKTNVLKFRFIVPGISINTDQGTGEKVPGKERGDWKIHYLESTGQLVYISNDRARRCVVDESVPLEEVTNSYLLSRARPCNIEHEVHWIEEEEEHVLEIIHDKLSLLDDLRKSRRWLEGKDVKTG